MKLKVNKRNYLADTHTPVELYLKIRDRFPQSVLLESNLNNKREESKSFIAFQPIATFKAFYDRIDISFGNEEETVAVDKLYDVFNDFLNRFEIENKEGAVYGHTNYEAIELFDTIKLNASITEDQKQKGQQIPLLDYKFYQYVIEFDHFSNQLSFIEYLKEEENSNLDALIKEIIHASYSLFNFTVNGKETCSNTADEFLDMVNKGKEHCQKGNVFQVVLSRRFAVKYKGDDFQVYRSLRSINPSPYLYYLDNGDYRIFGSSPETQVKVNQNKAIINPIAGTYKRTHDKALDRQLADKLLSDTKENAEHYMLVDLARNDLGRISNKVAVTSLRHIHYYSHVLHMVSEVEGELSDVSPMEVVGKTFPAGTLSGAPKYRAMQIIDELEKTERNYYGGAIGLFNLNGSSNHAIMIRSFLSRNNQLEFQAGAGVVINSDPQSELEEVDNKLKALRIAINNAEKL